MSGQGAVERERMRWAIAELPHQMQAVYRRHLFDGLDYPAIAAELGLNVREVERLIAQSIVRIDRALRRPGPERRQIVNAQAATRSEPDR